MRGSPRLLNQGSAYPNTDYPVRSLKFAVRGGFAAGNGIYSVAALIRQRTRVGFAITILGSETDSLFPGCGRKEKKKHIFFFFV